MTTIGEGSDEEECPVDMTQFALEASQVLYELSGRQFSGACEKTVRPCGNAWCGFQTLSRGYVVWNPYWWNPYWDGMSWWFQGANSCACRPLDRIKLSGYPVREITEVKIDGVVVDPATYRLDDRRWLVRVPDPLDPDVHLRWPACQAMGLPDDEEGTFSVTYRYGQDAPPLGIHAAAQLGCELYKACSGQTCALPTGTTRVNRQGITIEKPAFYSWGFIGQEPARRAPAGTPGCRSWTPSSTPTTPPGSSAGPCSGHRALPMRGLSDSDVTLNEAGACGAAGNAGRPGGEACGEGGAARWW